MKYLLALGITCLSLSLQSSAQTKKTGSKKTFELKGDVAFLKTPMMLLIYESGGKEIKDTSRLVNGKFRFTGTVDGPTYAQLWSSDANWANFQYLENTKMTLTKKGPGDEVVFTGSPSENEYGVIKKIFKEFRNKSNQADEEAGKIRKTDSAAAQKEYVRLEQAAEGWLYSQTGAYVVAHPKSVVGLNEMIKLARGMEVKDLQTWYAALDPALQASAAGQDLAAKIQVRVKTEIGANAQDFTQKDPEGKDVSLASFKGKYVLVDFWASWCVPCRKENPNVVKSYNKYKAKGFEILSVSLDKTADKWKEAIAKDQLTWTHVSDLKGWGNAVAAQYAVISVPTNFLIDPKGIIIAKNLRGEELDKKLSEIFAN